MGVRAVRKILLSDYEGKLVGDWRVLGYSHFNHEHYWKVQCSCGYITERRASQLHNGRTHSCRTCAAKKREHEKSPYWRGIDGISQQYLNRLSFRNKEVSITLQDLVDQWKKQDGKCVYTKEVLSLVRKDTGWKQSSASIDRIDSSIGYHVGNIQWVHKRINTMKNDMSEKEFISWCKKVVGGSCGV